MKKPLNIYLVDDDAFFVELITDILEDEGHSVLSNDSAVFSLSEIRRKVPDCVLVDLQMPEVDGLEMCRELRKSDETQRIKVIFVSAHTDQIWADRATEAGADSYITKPIDASTLIDTINSVMGDDQVA